MKSPLSAEQGDERWGELVDAWSEMQEEVDCDPQAYDRLVLQCARELAADPGGAHAYRWMLGLVMALAYFGSEPDAQEVREAAFDAARTVDRALREKPCGHREHPFQGDLAAESWSFPEILRDLGGGEPVGWVVPLPREQWRCPRNTAGYARVVMESLRPGTAEDVPPLAGRVFTATAVGWYVEAEADGSEDDEVQHLVAELTGAFERALGLLAVGP